MSTNQKERHERMEAKRREEWAASQGGWEAIEKRDIERRRNNPKPWEHRVEVGKND